MRPQENEHSPEWKHYIDLVPEDDVVSVMELQIESTRALLAPLSEAQAMHRYAPGKWSVKEIVGHLIDSERVISYRALCIARGETQSLPGFEQDDYVQEAASDERSLRDLLDEWTDLRRANVRMFRALTPEAWARIGKANDSPIGVRALAYAVPGHVRHHLGVVKERYLKAT